MNHADFAAESSRAGSPSTRRSVAPAAADTEQQALVEMQKVCDDLKPDHVEIVLKAQEQAVSHDTCKVKLSPLPPRSTRPPIHIIKTRR
jgi:hypothetical protein